MINRQRTGIVSSRHTALTKDFVPIMANAAKSPLIVLGQGIAGLSAAIALGDAGYPVHIIGRRQAATGGLQLSPNGFRALACLGLEKAVLNKAVRLNAVVIQTLSTNRHLTEIIHEPQHLHAAVSRQDVMDCLVAKAETLSCIRFTNTEIHTLNLDTEKAELVSADGDIFSADEVIGADGARGLARAVLTGQNSLPPPPAYRAMRAEIDAAKLPAAFRRPATMLMLGDGCHLVSYPIKGGNHANIVFCASSDRLSSGWPQRCFGLNPLLSDLTDPAISWANTPLFPAEVLPVWRRAHLTLLGDAAHVMPPHLAQGAGQTFLDAACLKGALTKKTLAQALDQMAATRSIEVQTVTKKAATSGEVMRLSGIASQARNIFIDMAGPGFMSSWLDEVWQAEN